MLRRVYPPSEYLPAVHIGPYEVVELGTGYVLPRHLANEYLIHETSVPRRFDSQTGQPYLDGCGVGYNYTPKHVALGRQDVILLNQIAPSIARLTKQYQDAVRALNRERFGHVTSIRMKRLWADPSSAYNTPEYDEKKRLALIRRWADPDSTLNSTACREKMSTRAKRLWADPVWRAKQHETNRKAQYSKRWEKNRVPVAMSWLFGPHKKHICPVCGWGSHHLGALKSHTTRKHQKF